MVDIVYEALAAEFVGEVYEVSLALLAPGALDRRDVLVQEAAGPGLGGGLIVLGRYYAYHRADALGGADAAGVAVEVVGLCLHNFYIEISFKVFYNLSLLYQ